MKNKLFLLGTLPVALLVGTIVMNSGDTPEGSYESRTYSKLEDPSASSNGMFEAYYQLRGDFTKEEYMRAVNNVKNSPSNRAALGWVDEGPDNIGGRTRAIVIDKDDYNVIYAGSVSGGLFKSINRANLWSPVAEFNANLSVSSMCQTADGTLYIGTGHEEEGTNGAFSSGAYGGGVFKSQTDGSYSLIPGTEDYDWINEVVCDTLNNVVWIACNEGLKKYTAATGAVTNATTDLGSGEVNALDISPDGQVIVLARGGNTTWVSTDGGANFINRSTGATGITASGVSRTEYSISWEKDEAENYHIYASQASGFLKGVWHSADNGATWTRIAPPNDQTPGSFAPFSSGGNGQGNYDNIIEAVRGNPKKVMLGGIDTYSWSTTGNWSQLSNWFLPPQSPLYVHADQHEMVWDKTGRLYLGNDGGVGISIDGGQTFYPANRGYNVTQFYNIGASGHGDVIGGAQDNGSLANYHDNSTWQEFDEVGGGDGFSAEISFTNRNLQVSSVYYSQVRRSADRGVNATTFVPTEILDGSSGCVLGSLTAGETCGSFFTRFKLWENPNDLNSTDTINFVPSQAYSAGDVVPVPSRTTQMVIDYTTPITIEFSDTVNYTPALTELDTIVTSLQGFSYNLNIAPYTYILGSPSISVGDSIEFTDLEDTIEVASISFINHYYANNSGATKTIDMGSDSVLYNISWDTLKVQDPYQSWFVLGLGGTDGVWMTRNALRFSAPSEEWFRVADVSGVVTALEFSQDGDYLWIGTSGGRLYRLTGFNDVYSPKKDYGNDVNDAGFFGDTLIDITTGGTVQTTLDQITGFGGTITDIAVEDDNDHVVVTVGGFSTSTKKIRESSNATTASAIADFTDITGNPLTTGLPAGLPVYCAVIQKDNSGTVLVGTEMGVYRTTNAGAGASWENVSGAFGNVPVFDMQQNWRDFNEGCNRPGEIYIGTHGRGIWATADYLSLPTDQDNLLTNKFIPNINVYPNPMNDVGNVGFSLENSSDVNIQVFNLNGQLVNEIKQANMPAGQNNITFGAAELSKGTYIIRLTAGDRVETSKFIKH